MYGENTKTIAIPIYKVLPYPVIICYFYIDEPESGDVRLSYTRSGRVEVFLSGRWQPVADSDMSWTWENSEVVCRELGYAPNGK